jgi:cytochrome c nitrite reductase small subunit
VSSAAEEGVRSDRYGIGLAGLFLSCVLGVLIGTGLFTIDYADATSYLSSDPAACVNCHIMREQYDGWQKAPHHAVAACNDCHVPHDLIGKYATKVDHGYRHSKGFTLQDFHEPIRIKEHSLRVVQENCLRCHADFVDPLVTHYGSTEEVVDCVHCHRDVGHGAR